MDSMLSVLNSYSLNLSPAIYTDKVIPSDQISFWQANYGAITVMEDYYSSDVNPYYHSINDRIDEFNFQYYHEVSKLAIGTIAKLATLATPCEVPLDSIDIDTDPVVQIHTIYPNPTSGSITIGLEKYEKAEVVNIIGQIILRSAKRNIDISNQPSGVYYIRMFTNDEIITEAILKK